MCYVTWFKYLPYSYTLLHSHLFQQLYYSLWGLVVQWIRSVIAHWELYVYSSHALCSMFSFSAFCIGGGSGPRQGYCLGIATRVRGCVARWSTLFLFVFWRGGVFYRV